MPERIDLSLAPDAGAASTARRSLDRLSGLVSAEKMEDARLMVSELLTNSVRHAGLSPEDQVDLKVSVMSGRLRAEVSDPGPGFERPPGVPRPDQPSGWGLFIVERLADRWGFERGEETTRVWFEIDL